MILDGIDASGVLSELMRLDWWLCHSPGLVNERPEICNFVQLPNTHNAVFAR